MAKKKQNTPTHTVDNTGKTDLCTTSDTGVSANSHDDHSLKLLALAKIVLKPELYRHFEIDKEGVKRLCESIKERGLMVPVIVWETPDGYLLISGYHRYEAFNNLGIGVHPSHTQSIL